MPVVRGIKNPVIVQAPEYPPSHEELVDQALAFLKSCKKKQIKGMPKAEVLEWAEMKARAAKSQAESLIASGMWENQAWNMAIRQEILESESD